MSIRCVGLTRSDIVAASTRKGHLRGWRSIRKVCRYDSERSESVKPENGNRKILQYPAHGRTKTKEDIERSEMRQAQFSAPRHVLVSWALRSSLQAAEGY